MVDRGWTKVFGIGLSRTGTTSLSHAFRILGFSAVHLPVNVKAIDEADFSDDLSVTMRFRWLDQKYPGSKFILTTREKSEWLKNCREFFSTKPFPKGPKTRRWTIYVHNRVYGCRWFDEEAFFDAWDRHEAYVRSYFRDRPGDLLIMNICAGDGWEKLCPFIGVDPPGVAFPHVWKIQQVRKMYSK